MKSFNYWNNKKLYQEIAITTNRKAIIQGSPTLPSIRDNIFRNSQVEPDIMAAHDEIGNSDGDEDSKKFPPHYSGHGDDTAPSTESGGIIDGPNGSLDDVIDAIEDLSKRNGWNAKYTVQLLKQKLKQRFGSTGMEKLSNHWHADENMPNGEENFNMPPLGDIGTDELKFSEPAGQTPVLSQGVPVSPKLESFLAYVKEQGQQQGQPVDPAQQQAIQQVMAQGQEEQQPDVEQLRKTLQDGKVASDWVNRIITAASLKDATQRISAIEKLQQEREQANQATASVFQQSMQQPQ